MAQTAAARYQVHRLRRLQRLGRRRGRHRRGAGHRMGRAAGGDRQLPAQVRLSRLVQGSIRTAASKLQRRERAQRGRGATASSCAANTCMSPKVRKACASTTSPASPTRVSRSKIITAPFSPLGQDTHIASKNATCVVLRDHQPVDPGAQPERADAGRATRNR